MLHQKHVVIIHSGSFGMMPNLRVIIIRNSDLELKILIYYDIRFMHESIRFKYGYLIKCVIAPNKSAYKLQP